MFSTPFFFSNPDKANGASCHAFHHKRSAICIADGFGGVGISSPFIQPKGYMGSCHAFQAGAKHGPEMCG